MSNFEMSTLLRESIAACLRVPVEQLDAYIAQRREQRRRHAAAKNARYAQALSHVTDVQACVVERLQQDGYLLADKMWQDKQSLNVARLLSKRCWNAAKGQISTKLVMVYPDGSRAETFERSISIRKTY